MCDNDIRMLGDRNDRKIENVSISRTTVPNIIEIVYRDVLTWKLFQNENVLRNRIQRIQQ